MQTKQPTDMKTLPPTATGLSPSRALGRAALLGLTVLSLAAASIARAAAPWSTVANPEIMQPGIAAVTCAAPTFQPFNTAFTFALFDLRNPPGGAFYGPCPAPLWVLTPYDHPLWTVTNIGNVFGITLDRDGDMYIAAHGLYSKTWVFTYHHRYGALGGWAPTAPLVQRLQAAGTIYRIDRITGVPSVFNVAAADRLPQQAMNLGGGLTAEGPGIGNLAYDSVNDQFFASNLEDGKIYRINNSGVVVQIYDPLVADTGAAGLPPLTEIVWGLAVSGGKLYYAVWAQAH